MFSILVYAVIGDEATDVVNREQLNLSIRWVNDDYEVNEDPVGLFSVPDTTSNTLTKVIQGMLKHSNLTNNIDEINNACKLCHYFHGGAIGISGGVHCLTLL